MSLHRVFSPAILVAFCLLVLAGCLHSDKGMRTPTSVGLNTNNLIDPAAQPDEQEGLRQMRAPSSLTMHAAAKRHSLCLSGGGAYGAYTVGVLNGWTARGDRPCFDVVTGISTGALIAPFAFLGSQYDPLLKDLYTTMDASDIYRLKPLTGIFSESFASSRPLARKIEELSTMELMTRIAQEHAKGRRLYIGTTEMEGHRFVVWDIGAIACGGRLQDLELIQKLMLASSAIPGIFPPVRIPVTVNGQPFIEFHVDGSVSQSVFFRPPTEKEGNSPQGTQVYVIVAGKIYADAEAIKPSAINIAIGNLQSFSYAHCRGDLYRIWSICQFSGRHFHMASLGNDYPAPTSMVEFDRQQMAGMYQEGVRQMMTGTAWRSTPPGMAPGEGALVRGSTDLVEVPRSGVMVPVR